MDPIAPLIDHLHQDGRPRVWSLVITVFGDSVQPRGGLIATARLGILLGRLGIEPGALRTALSRLARDGWVDRVKQGRHSFYQLTTKGRATFGPATERIYAAPRRAGVTVWEFTTDPDAQGVPMAGGVLRPATAAPGPAEHFALRGQISPGTRQAVERSLDPLHVAALQALAQDLRALSQVGTLPPLDAVAARTLLVHRWRRLVLRWPEVPADIMPASIMPEQIDPPDLHASVARAYQVLSPAADAWLDAELKETKPMPAPDASLTTRFQSG